MVKEGKKGKKEKEKIPFYISTWEDPGKCPSDLYRAQCWPNRSHRAVWPQTPVCLPAHCDNEKDGQRKGGLQTQAKEQVVLCSLKNKVFIKFQDCKRGGQSHQATSLSLGWISKQPGRGWLWLILFLIISAGECWGANPRLPLCMQGNCRARYWATSPP